MSGIVLGSFVSKRQEKKKIICEYCRWYSGLTCNRDTLKLHGAARSSERQSADLSVCVCVLYSESWIENLFLFYDRSTLYVYK
jgi:hypothetical protein